jgi:hypothetical protein
MTATRTQELRTLREESDWVAEQLQRLQRVVTHVMLAERPHSADRRRPARRPA